jgi:Tol biopolymer transport system component
MQADGTNAVQLTNNPAFDLDPAWSPDGRSIAFTSTRDGKSEVYVMDASGSGQTRFTNEGGRHPAWAPGGAHLAYAAPFCPGYPYACYTTVFVKPRSGAADRLPYGPGERPAWSPDGRKVTFNNFLCDYYLSNCNPVGFSIVRLDGTDVIGGGTDRRNAVWRP